MIFSNYPKLTVIGEQGFPELCDTDKLSHNYSETLHQLFGCVEIIPVFLSSCYHFLDLKLETLTKYFQLCLLLKFYRLPFCYNPFFTEAYLSETLQVVTRVAITYWIHLSSEWIETAAH